MCRSDRVETPAVKRSDLGHAAVYEELDACHVTAFVGSEKRNYLCNFVQTSRATEWYFAHDTVDKLLDLFVVPAQGVAVARRRNHARTNGVHADLAVFEVRGESAREGPYGGFGCAIDAES